MLNYYILLMAALTVSRAQMMTSEMSTTEGPSTMTMSTPGPQPDTAERECACTPRNMWLDISILVESSSAMTQNGLSEISATLAAVVDEMTISQSIDQASRIAITVYSDISRPITNLASYNDALSVQMDLLSLSTSYYSDNSNPNMLSGTNDAISVFNANGNRLNTRNVLVIVASSYAGGTQTDVQQAANQFKSSNGVVVVIAYQQPNQAPIPGICNLASPGACFTVVSTDDNSPLVGNLLQALCIANCFCKKNEVQYTGMAGNVTTFHGSCLHPVTAPTTGNLANLTCASQASRVVQILNREKYAFVQLFALNNLGTDQSWISLYYRADLVPAGWYWTTLGGPIAIAGSVVEENWWPGNPNRTNGDCVQLKRYTGFQLRMLSAPCSGVSYAYSCQHYSCDTDNYCPDALGRDFIAEW